MGTISKPKSVMTALAEVSAAIPDKRWSAADGKRFRDIRVSRRLSQRDLETKGVSYAYISRIEAGTRIPSVRALIKLSLLLDVSLMYLISGRGSFERLTKSEADSAFMLLGASDDEFDELNSKLENLKTAYGRAEEAYRLLGE